MSRLTPWRPCESVRSVKGSLTMKIRESVCEKNRWVISEKVFPLCCVWLSRLYWLFVTPASSSVIDSCIPTQQDYQTWVSVIHCAWHPLFKCLSNFVFWLSSFYLWKRGIFHPLVPAGLYFFEWRAANGCYPWCVVLTCWAASRCIEDSLRSESTLENEKKKNFLLNSCMLLFCLRSSVFILQTPLCKWPQPNSQWVMGVNCNWKLLLCSPVWNEERIQYITVGADSNFLSLTRKCDLDI